MKAQLAAGLAAAMLIASSAAAQTVLVNDNFDGYANQAAFEAVWVPIGGGTPTGSLGVIGGTLSTEQAVSPTFSVKNVSPPATNPPEPSTSAYSQRNQRTFAESGTISTTLGIRFSYDFYDFAPTASPYRQFVNLQDGLAPGVANELIGLGMNNNQSGLNSGGQYYMGRILGYTATTVDPDGGPDESVVGSGAFFKLNDFGAPHRTTGWHNLKVEITTDDGLSSDYKFYVDNILCEQVLNFSTAATFRSYDVLRMGSGNSSTTDAYYDNVKVETFTPVVPSTNDADFNEDGIVDGADFMIWQIGQGSPAAAGDDSTGDADGDLDVDAVDLGTSGSYAKAWKLKYGGLPAMAAVTAIPEPASMLLSALALVGVASRRRK